MVTPHRRSRNPRPSAHPPRPPTDRMPHPSPICCRLPHPPRRASSCAWWRPATRGQRREGGERAVAARRVRRWARPLSHRPREGEGWHASLDCLCALCRHQTHCSRASTHFDAWPCRCCRRHRHHRPQRRRYEQCRALNRDARGAVPCRRSHFCPSHLRRHVGGPIVGSDHQDHWC